MLPHHFAGVAVLVIHDVTDLHVPKPDKPARIVRARYQRVLVKILTRASDATQDDAALTELRPLNQARVHVQFLRCRDNVTDDTERHRIVSKSARNIQPGASPRVPAGAQLIGGVQFPVLMIVSLVVFGDNVHEDAARDIIGDRPELLVAHNVAVDPVRDTFVRVDMDVRSTHFDTLCDHGIDIETFKRILLRLLLFNTDPVYDVKNPIQGVIIIIVVIVLIIVPGVRVLILWILIIHRGERVLILPVNTPLTGVARVHVVTVSSNVCTDGNIVCVTIEITVTTTCRQTASSPQGLRSTTCTVLRNTKICDRFITVSTQTSVHRIIIVAVEHAIILNTFVAIAPQALTVPIIWNLGGRVHVVGVNRCRYHVILARLIIAARNSSLLHVRLRDRGSVTRYILIIPVTLKERVVVLIPGLSSKVNTVRHAMLLSSKRGGSGSQGTRTTVHPATESYQ